jgi:hypothetical protein
MLRAKMQDYNWFTATRLVPPYRVYVSPTASLPFSPLILS